MTTNLDATCSLTSAEEAYVLAVFREVARIAARSRHAFDADDIAGEVALTLVGRPTKVMASYPDPVHYARQRARHAGISFDRRERSQRGEGARLYIGADGQLQPARRYLSTDAVSGDGPLSHRADQGTLPDIEVTERMVVGALLQRCCDGLSPSDVQVAWLIDGCGYTVQQVAAMRGQRRETLSRRLNKVRKRMQQNACL